jgi:GAF domain-containing protein
MLLNDDGSGLAREFAELAQALQTAGRGLGSLQTLCELAVRLVPADAASISIRRGSSLRSIATTSPTAEAMVRIQDETGEGPCPDVESAEETAGSIDLCTETRWPGFARRAVAEHGVRSVLSHRLFVRDGAAASLTMYAVAPRAFGPSDTVVVGIFAAHAAVALQAAEEQERADNLEIALRTSRRIGTAIGILMHQHRVDEHEAFELLRRRSQDTNRKLADIADEVAWTGAF